MSPPRPDTLEGTFCGKSSLQAYLEIPLGMPSLEHQSQMAEEQSQVLPPAPAGLESRWVRRAGKTPPFRQMCDNLSWDSSEPLPVPEESW